MISFIDSYHRLAPGRKKFLHISVGICLLMLLVFSLSSLSSGEKSKARGKQTITSVLTDQDPRQVGLDSLNSTQAEQGRMLAETQRNVKSLMEKNVQTNELKEQLSEVNKALGDVQVQVETAAQETQLLRDQNKKLLQDIESLAKKQPAPGKEQDAADKAASLKQDAIARKKYESLVVSPNQNQTAFFANAPRPVEEVTKPGQAARNEEKTKITTIAEEVKEEEEDPTKDQDVYLPAGSIMSGAIITGIDAPTGSGARRDPFPVLLRVKKEAVLPNRYRADIRECFLIASAFGDLSSERAYMRAETISCIRDDGNVIESGLDAYAAGEDGKAGVRGRLISKQGAILARSLMAGFMQGVSEAFNVRSVPSINLTGSGTSNSSETITPVYEQAFNADSMQGAAVGGAGRALERIADFYLEMAENLYPVIEIDAAREIDFIVKKGVQLKLQTKNGTR